MPSLQPNLNTKYTLSRLPMEETKTIVRNEKTENAETSEIEAKLLEMGTYSTFYEHLIHMIHNISKFDSKKMKIFREEYQPIDLQQFIVCINGLYYEYRGGKIMAKILTP